MISFTIPGRPVTKKNSMRIAARPDRGRFLMQSERYIAYETAAGYFIPCKRLGIDYPVNVRCVYYMPDHRRVDLTNLLAATDDILVKYGVLKDDNSNIVYSHDGSRVRYDRQAPRAEIEISGVEAFESDGRKH